MAEISRVKYSTVVKLNNHIGQEYVLRHYKLKKKTYCMATSSKWMCKND